MAINYNIVKYCRTCKKRYLVNKGEAKKVYCAECFKKLCKNREKE